MKTKVLLLLALTLLAFTSTIATTTLAFNNLTPNSFGIRSSIAEIIDSEGQQPSGDPVDDPFAPM